MLRSGKRLWGRRGIAGILCLAFLGSSAQAATAIDICAINESEFVSTVKNMHRGASLVAHVQGTSVPLIVAEKVGLVVAGTAGASAATVTAVAAAGAFTFLASYCNTPVAIDIGKELHGAAVSRTVDAFEVSASTYEAVVSRTSTSIEGAAALVTDIRRKTTDLFCWGGAFFGRGCR